MVRIAVVGAGIVGLTTAVNIQKEIPQASVTLIADKFDTETTSTGAGGLYRPTTKHIKGVSPEVIRGWVEKSWEYFSGLAQSPLAGETGQSLVPGYIASNDRHRVEHPLYQDIVFNFRLLTPQELERLNFPCKYGSTFQTVVTQPKKFMPWLLKQFTSKGGKVQRRRLDSLKELLGSYEVVVNCSALGSQKLLPDPSMYPIKGQLVMLKAPWVKTFVYIENPDQEPTYFIPHDDYLIVGGTREQGNYNLNIDKNVQASILTRAERYVPQIKGAEVVGNWTGLRPHRDPIRLEKELMDINGRKLRVVHNYGHGANGVALSWGTALEAAQLTKQWTDQLQASSKL